MDPTQLIGPTSPLGYPAPYGFILFFKVLGFTLHMSAMNLWYAGPILAMLLRLRGGEEAVYLSDRLMSQMPIIIAYGVNFGIIPLLFIQVAYYRVFYPATILMAWPWFIIVPLLTIAYYGIYLYVIGLREGKNPILPSPDPLTGGARITPSGKFRASSFKSTAGWVSAFLFIVMGYLFSHGMSLLTNLNDWPSIFEKTSVAGAPLGIGFNSADPTLLPRWLMMFGLALTTTGAYIVVDMRFLARKVGEGYRRWAGTFALKVYTLGVLWFAITGSWYVFGTWQTEVRQVMFRFPQLILTILTAIAPGLPLLLILRQAKDKFLAERHGAMRRLAFLTGLTQFIVVALNAISRQIVQNAELGKFLDVSSEEVHLQWSPLILFLVLFAAGLSVIFWMIHKVVTAEGQVPKQMV